MHKIVIHRAGGYDQLKVENHTDLICSGAEVVVETCAAGVNYADCCVRWGVYESAKKYVGWPITPGFEFSGKVIKIGSEVTKFKLGDLVFGITFFNGYASQVKVLEKHLFELPSGFTLEQAAGFPAVFMTAYHALFQLVRLPPQSKILIHSAAGGVGAAILQLARSAGYKTVAVVGASHKIDYVKSLGADFIVDKSKEDLWRRVHDIFPEGYDAVLDANGASTLSESYNCLRATGKLIAYGSHSILPSAQSGRMNYLKAGWGMLKTPRFNPLKLISENKSVIGFNLSFLFNRDDLVSEGMEQLISLIDQGKVIPPKITVMHYSEVAKAHQLIESAQSVGKIVLKF